MKNYCSNCTGGLHHVCSPPCACGCETSNRLTKEWLERNKAWLGERVKSEQEDN